MSLIDTYRRNIERKRSEISSLLRQKSIEIGKIASISKKIQSARHAISTTKSSSTIKTRLSEIARYENEITRRNKKIAELERKIATKEKECISEEKKYRLEEEKLRKKQISEDKKRQNESERALKRIDKSIFDQERRQMEMQLCIDRLSLIPEKITVLFLASNPKDTSKLRLDEEARSIQEMIRKSEHRDSISFESRWAVRPLDILQAINEVNPDVVHFSGHGAETGEILLENTNGTEKLVTKEAVAQTIMSSTDKIHLMFFNACFSYEQAQQVVNYVDAAIGMTDSITDNAACVFAAQFYSSLGFGFSVEKAFEQAKGAMMLESVSEENIPILCTKEGVDPSTLFIVKPVN